ncbi:DUF4258 domain-containing protein [Candidatus Kaiserbacteria bacterium]|nr:MAG: DUF4258 domain-containing protein [Candidatus Kaiserbacteria bacterium]
MKIVFSKHSLLQIKQRDLDKAKVLATIEQPDFIEPTYNFREERYRLYAKNHLKVVVKIEELRIVVVTAHWVAKHKTK